MMNEKEKLESLKESLKIIKKYDVNGNLDYVSKLVKDGDDLSDTISSEFMNELSRSTVASYTDEKSLEKKDLKK